MKKQRLKNPDKFYEVIEVNRENLIEVLEYTKLTCSITPAKREIHHSHGTFGYGDYLVKNEAPDGRGWFFCHAKNLSDIGAPVQGRD